MNLKSILRLKVNLNIEILSKLSILFHGLTTKKYFGKKIKKKIIYFMLLLKKLFKKKLEMIYASFKSTVGIYLSGHVGQDFFVNICPDKYFFG